MGTFAAGGALQAQSTALAMFQTIDILSRGEITRKELEAAVMSQKLPWLTDETLGDFMKEACVDIGPTGTLDVSQFGSAYIRYMGAGVVAALPVQASAGERKPLQINTASHSDTSGYSPPPRAVGSVSPTRGSPPSSPDASSPKLPRSYLAKVNFKMFKAARLTGR